MATSQNTVTALLALVKQRSYQPANGGPTNAAILRDLNTEMLTYVSPLLATIGEEFFVAPYPFTTVAGQQAYDIPGDSIGSRIRDVQVLANDNVSWVSLAHEEPERAAGYQINAVRPSAYFVRGNQFHLLPKPSTSSQAMRILYYKRPREMVNSGYSVGSNCTLVGPNYEVTVASTAGMTDGNFDIDDTTTGEILVADLPGTVYSSTVLRFPASGLTSDQITALLADYTSTFIGSGLAYVADVPPEAAVLLAQRVACVILQEQGNPKAPSAYSELERVKQVVQTLFAPRTSGRGRKVVNRNGPGWGAWRWGWGRNWGN